MAKTIKLNPDEQQEAHGDLPPNVVADMKVPEAVRDQETQTPKNDPSKKAFEDFMAKWYTFDTNKKLNILLDMVMNAGAKLDMLAAAVYSEPIMKKHLDKISNRNPQMKGEKNGKPGNEGDSN
jgi:hypothetical protein